ncbi:MAG: ABC transporter ATP-binding protein, partial [Pseudomonadota bacterium]
FDVETLDLLEDILGDYDGTVLLVSHDRDFLDRVATATVAFEGRGRLTVYAGGWSDYLAQRGPVSETIAPGKTKAQKPSKDAPRPAAKDQRPSFTEKHRLDALPGEIDTLNAEIAKLEQFLAQPDLYQKEPAKFAKASAALVARQTALSEAEDDWLSLAEKAEG